MNSGLKIFLKGSTVSIIAIFLVGCFNYLTRRAMALNLDLELYGFFYSALSLAMLITTYVDLGFNKSATILIAKYLAINENFKTNSTFWALMLIKFFTGLLSAVGLFLLIDTLLSEYFQFPAGRPILRLFCLFIIVTAISGLIKATLDAYKEYVIKSYLQVGGTVIVLFGVYWGVNKYPFYAPIISYIISASIIFLVGLKYLIRNKGLRYPKTDFFASKASVLECWKHGKWIALATASMSTMYYMDTIMLTHLSNLESVALYNIALPIMQIYQSLFVFHIVLTPIASEFWHKGEKEELKALFNKINLAAIFILICGSGIIFLTPFNFHMIQILFSPDFTSANSTLNILCFGMLILAVGQLYATTLMAIGRSQTVASINIIAALFNIMANIILIPKFNISGAASATALSYLLLSTSCIWSFRKTMLKQYRSVHKNAE